MTRATYHWVLLLTVFACERTAEVSPPPTPCDMACEELRIRKGSSDLLVRAPGLWRFYDDFSSQLPRPPECGIGPESFGDMKPLWRRTLAGILPTTGLPVTSPFESRSSVSVASGRLAANLAGIMWIIDARSGIPQHAWERTFRGPNNENVGFGDRDFVALTPDAKMAWFSVVEAPALIDLESIDRKLGPKYTFSWYLDRPEGDSGTTTDVWTYPSPALGPDGTLFAKSQDGHVRAMSPQGSLTWSRYGLAWGFAFTDAEGTSYWSGPSGPVAIHATDGSVKWRAEERPEFVFGYLLDVERSGTRSYLAYGWTNATLGRSYVVAYSTNNGSILWIRDFPDHELQVGNLGGLDSPQAAQAPDGTLFLSSSTHDGPQALVGLVRAFDGSSGAIKWATALPLPEGIPATTPHFLRSYVLGGPVPGRSSKGGVYLSTGDCKVYHLDRDGNISGWYQMGGVPVRHVPQLADGILYVVAWVPNQLAVGDRACPGDNPNLAVDRYECLSSRALSCSPCIEGRHGGVYWIYAFETE